MNGTRPRTEDLVTFLAVVDEGGIGAAARALGLPKSTVSRRVVRLESEVGARLLARSRRAVLPTEAGTRVVERVRNALADLDALSAAARGGRDTPRGRLRISAPADLAADDEVWLSFVQQHPEVELHLELTNRYVDVVREGYDVAVRGGRGDDEALIARRLGSYALRAVSSPAWLADNGKLGSPGELRRHSCALLRPFSGSERAPRGRRHLVFNQLHLVHRACRQGLGVAILPASLVDADVTSGDLVPVLDAYDPLEVPLYAAYPDRRFLPAATVALLDHLADAYGS